VARIRSIHPDICIDKGLADMDNARAERTFMRLWTYCDDEGRAIDDARLIKAAIYPRLDAMTYAEVEADIVALAQEGFIVRYGEDGENYLHVPSFSKWQKPNRKIPSKLPAPTEANIHCMSSEHAVSTHDNVLPVVVVGDVDVDVDVDVQEPIPFEDDFNKCWGIYPRKQVRKLSLKAYQAQRRKKVSAKTLFAATQHFAAQMKKEERSQDMIMMGSTFFGPNDRWEDFVKAPPKPYVEPVSQTQGDMFPPGPEGEALRKAWHAEHSNGTIKLPGES
jgi:hypothetical protein